MKYKITKRIQLVTPIIAKNTYSTLIKTNAETLAMTSCCFYLNVYSHYFLFLFIRNDSQGRWFNVRFYFFGALTKIVKTSFNRRFSHQFLQTAGSNFLKQPIDRIIFFSYFCAHLRKLKKKSQPIGVAGESGPLPQEHRCFIFFRSFSDLKKILKSKNSFHPGTQGPSMRDPYNAGLRSWWYYGGALMQVVSPLSRHSAALV